ncbi:unnamed protein product [Phytophthora lilii]|uniref:Unnamed protein product n=1 Tax=Phytophthora lilii TaxID=2077276 RepID=A0A9W6U3V0_9STRA|nr:unnamed protein product [Phytophthora lilii]
MLFDCRNIVLDAIALNQAKIELQRWYPTECFGDNISCALHLAAQAEIAAKLHSKQPSALISTYSGYHEPAFVKMHSTLIRGSPSLSLSTQAKLDRRESSVKDKLQGGLLCKVGQQIQAKRGSPRIPKLSGGFVQVLPWSGDRTLNKQPQTVLEPRMTKSSHPPLLLQSIETQESAKNMVTPAHGSVILEKPTSNPCVCVAPDRNDPTAVLHHHFLNVFLR